MNSNILNYKFISRIIKITLIIAVVLFLNKKCDTLVLNVPIALHQAGNVVEADFEIPQNDHIWFYLQFSFNKNEMANRENLLNFVGRISDPIYNGFVVPLKIKLIKYNENKIGVFIIDKTYATFGINGWSSLGLRRNIDELSINKGKYHIRLETTNSFPQLTDTPVRFEIRYIRAPF